MKLQISEDVLSETRKCRKKFVCLEGNSECLCELKSCVDDTVCFVSVDRRDYCEYMVCFGYSVLCACPTRKEIYRSYRI